MDVDRGTELAHDITGSTNETTTFDCQFADNGEKDEVVVFPTVEIPSPDGAVLEPNAHAEAKLYNDPMSDLENSKKGQANPVASTSHDQSSLRNKIQSTLPSKPPAQTSSVVQNSVMNKIADILPELPFQLLDAIIEDECTKCVEYSRARNEQDELEEQNLQFLEQEAELQVLPEVNNRQSNIISYESLYSKKSSYDNSVLTNIEHYNFYYPQLPQEELNTSYYGFGDSSGHPIEYNIPYQTLFLPEGQNVYYPCLDDLQPVYLPEKDYAEQQLETSNEFYDNYGISNEISLSNWQEVHQEKYNQTGSNLHTLKYPYLLDEEEIRLILNLDKNEKKKPQMNVLPKFTDRGIQALNLEDYILIHNISTLKPKISKSCSNLLNSKSKNVQDGNFMSKIQQESYEIGNSNVKTKSVGNITNTLQKKERMTQTDVLDIKIPFKIIIPTKYKTGKEQVQSTQITTDFTKKSVAQSIISRKPSHTYIKTKYAKLQSTEPAKLIIEPSSKDIPSTSRCEITEINVVHPVKLSTDVSLPKRQSNEQATGGLRKKSSTAMNSPTVKRSTEVITPTPITCNQQDSPQAGITLDGDVDGDDRLTVPRRKYVKPGEQAHVSYAQVVVLGKNNSESSTAQRTENINRQVVTTEQSSVQSPMVRRVDSQRRLEILNHNERLRRIECLRRVEYLQHAPPPSTYAEAAARMPYLSPRSSRQELFPQMPQPSQQYRQIPQKPQTSNTLTFLELTNEKRFDLHGFQEDYTYYIGRGMQFKYVTKKLVLLVFLHEKDAEEVLRHPCVHGTLVRLSEATTVTREMASTYKYVSNRRRNKSNRNN